MKKVLAFLLFVCYTRQVRNKKYIIWLPGQAVKTLASHAGIRGSIPLGVTFERVSAEEFCGYFFA